MSLLVVIGGVRPLLAVAACSGGVWWRLRVAAHFVVVLCGGGWWQRLVATMCGGAGLARVDGALRWLWAMALGGRARVVVVVGGGALWWRRVAAFGGGATAVAAVAAAAAAASAVAVATAAASAKLQPRLRTCHRQGVEVA